jgi:uncharacterized membrane protein YdbT with pleckstrin-like domain
MRYIDESLAPGETVIRRGKWPFVFWLGAWAALLLLSIIVVGVFIFIGLVVKMKTTDFAVTNRRIILKEGWLTRHTSELAVENVEGVSLDQSLIGRLFGFGRVVVTGTGDATIVFPPMANPVDFRRAIESARAECGEQRVVERIVETPTPANEHAAADRVEEEELPRRRKRGSFIGLRAR